MDNLMYQLMAEGRCRNFNQKLSLSTTTVYTTPAVAESRIDRFREIVTDPKRLDAMCDDEHLTIRVVPLVVISE